MGLEAAYIVPHPPLAVAEVGRGEEKAIHDTLAAYQEVSRRIAEHNPDTILFVSPHSAYYSDWIYLASGERAQGSLSMFGAPQVEFSLSYDSEYRSDLIAEAECRGVPAGVVGDSSHELDHGLLVPLYFINESLTVDSFLSVSMGGSGLPASVLVEFGRSIAAVSLKRKDRVVLVVSGDLSHKLKEDGPYGFDPAGPAFDEIFGRIVRSGTLMDFAHINERVSRDAAECGLSGFIMLAGVLDEIEQRGEAHFESELLSLEGPFGVGYGVAAFEQRKEEINA